ncbi:LOW QUALITY PROTEIN: reverse transcriptase [Phytophthora megakarya]|uniref:Reverse transcriptase n=1 Tax=Phytophthora megakarya TaxID=4795 RepID=A0A225VMY0_9STRA|nr:LOW QUALITY PROTEIN: reverse transcriptase [Phytophthora megakarya]
MGAGITSREHLDEAVETLIPLKGHVRKPPVVSVEMLRSDFQGVVLSFDGAAKRSTKEGSCGCVLWQLPDWKILKAKGFLLENVTVNDAEYHGLLEGLKMAIEMRLQDLVAVGDSRIVIQQVQGLINCNQSHLQKHLAKVETLILDESWDVTDTAKIAHLEHVSKIAEKLMKVEDLDRKSGYCQETSNSLLQSIDKISRVLAAVTRSKSQAESTSRDRPMNPLEFQAERWRRIRAHQDADEYLSEIKDFLKEDFETFSPRRLRKVAKVADLFVLDTRDVLYRLARSTRDRPRGFQDEPRLVVPKALRDDVLHYGHEDFQGGHQGITRAHKRLCSEFYWPGMYADVEHFVKECVDCASGKGRPPNAGPSPGNIEPRRPFEVVSMDFVTNMPKSDQGNSFLLLFQDMFSGYVMCKPMDSTTAQDVAEAYAERVFRNFGASSMIRHDQDPRFMSEVFTRFRELLNCLWDADLKQMDNRNDLSKRLSIRAYIEQADQSDWDDRAERRMFALNTLFDATRLDTPFYLIHGWDLQSTLKAMLGPTPSSVPKRTAYEWRRNVQRDYSYAKACAEDLQNKARRHRSDLQTQKWKELCERLKSGFQKWDAVWLYIPKVQTGLSKKLTHLWHGPFRIDKVLDDFRVKLKVDSTGYRVNPWVHISRLKPRALFSKRSTVSVDVDEEDGFDAALLPEDSWEADVQKDEYEVEKFFGSPMI